MRALIQARASWRAVLVTALVPLATRVSLAAFDHLIDMLGEQVDKTGNRLKSVEMMEKHTNAVANGLKSCFAARHLRAFPWTVT